MKILWAKTDFLHPTTRGGQIRTLEMLRHIHRHHEVHYVGFEDPASPEGVRRSSEYASHIYPVSFTAVPKRSLRFAGQLAAGLFSSLPVAGTRYRSEAMRQKIAKLVHEQEFDAKICDFLSSAINIDDMSGWVLFQHNVETIIWERHAQSGRTPVHRAYLGQQACRMADWERSVCRSAAHVIAVSKVDEQVMRGRFGLKETSSVATGVDLEYFERPAAPVQSYDLVFVGSMDWMPNIDGVRWFLDEVFPLIRAKKPDCRLAIVGRQPPMSLVSQAQDLRITVTGTVPDVRSYLWESAVSIVPLRVGGGTRLKIFEAMAAGAPVVSTTVGAEGLPVRHGDTISIADTAEDFAAECLNLLHNSAARIALVERGLDLIRSRFSWEQIARQFEDILRAVSKTAAQTA